MHLPKSQVVCIIMSVEVFLLQTVDWMPDLLKGIISQCICIIQVPSKKDGGCNIYFMDIKMYTNLIN